MLSPGLFRPGVFSTGCLFRPCFVSPGLVLPRVLFARGCYHPGHSSLFVVFKCCVMFDVVLLVVFVFVCVVFVRLL
jgi:hypothetical protein